MKTLIVEDDLMTQCVLAQALTELGHEVVSYENAEQAVLAYQKEFYPLLFVDAALPGMGGLQFCKWVRSQPNGDRVFIMVAPSRGQPADMAEILEVGANDFLPKPFGPSALKVRLTIAEKQMRDFFERKELEASLRQSQQGFHRLVNTANEGVWLLDEEFKTEYGNQQIAAMLGCPVEELAGRPAVDLIDSSGVTDAKSLFADQRQGRESKREIVLRRRDGSTCPAFLAATPVMDEAGKFRGSLWLVTDLTKHRHLEGELTQTRGKFEAEIKKLSATLEKSESALLAEKTEKRSLDAAVKQMRGEQEGKLRDFEAERAKWGKDLKVEAAIRTKSEQELARLKTEMDQAAKESAEELTRIRQKLEEGRTEAKRLVEAMEGLRREHKGALAQLKATGDAVGKERDQLSESLRAAQSEMERLTQTHREESEAARQAHQAALEAKSAELSGLREEAERLNHRHGETLQLAEKTHKAALEEAAQEVAKIRDESANRMKELDLKLSGIAQQLETEKSARSGAEQEAVRLRQEVADLVKRHTEELLKLNESLKSEMVERKRAGEELSEVRAELNQRAKDHTAELMQSGESLRAMVAERTRVEETLTRMREEADARVSEQARELLELRSQLEARSTETARLAAERDESSARALALETAGRKMATDLETAGRWEGREMVYSRLGRALAECATHTDAARVVANAAQELFGWDACSLDLFSVEENRVYPVLNVDTVNGRPAEVPATYLDLGPTPIMHRVLKEGPQLVLRKGAGGSHTDQVLFGDRARLSASLMCVPIKSGGKVAGFFAIQSYAADAFGADDLTRFEGLADHFVGALERVRAEELQRRSEDRFHLVARATTDIVWDWNVPMNQVWRNDVFQTVFGFRPEDTEMGIESWETRLHPDDSERVIRSLRKCLDQNDPFWSAEYRFRRADGSYAHVNDRGYVIRDKHGKAIRMVGAMLDNSHHKQVEEAMIEGQARKGAILESALDGIMTIDHEGRIFEWNPAAERMFGYRRADVLGKELGETIIPEALRERYRREMGQHLASGGGAVIGKRVELTAVRAGGVEFPVELAISRIPTEGSPIFTGFIRDITDRKRAELEIQKLAAFPRRNPNPVFEFAGDGSLTYFNDAAQEMALSLGKDHPLSILPENGIEIVKDCLVKGQNKLRIETVINGRTISWSFFPITANQVVHCYAADITERTSLEAQLRQAQKMESVGQLAAGVAHDFNNILSVIQGYSALLMEEKDLKSETGEALKQINSATQRATHLTRQLLTFSRKQAMHVQTLDLNEVINSVSKLLRRVLGESVSVQFDFTAGLAPVEADTGMMEQIVMNLAINARDAMAKGGQLTISTASVDIDESYAEHNPEARPGRFVCLSVTDTGCGMDEGTLARIFEPFFTTKPAGRGTGLGLATVYGIVKQHQGWIEVQSQIGNGTSFKIYLPASERTLAPAVEGGTRQVVRGGSETVLLVEDEPAVLAMASGILERLGYKVIEAPSGDDAAAVWAQRRSEINLLLTDMVMPGELNGRQLAEKLLADRPDLKVMYTSGYSVDLLGSGLASNRNFVFLQKPYHPDTLALMVRNCLDAA